MNHDDAVNKFLDEYDQLVSDAGRWREFMALAQKDVTLRPAAELAAKNALEKSLAKNVASATVEPPR
jgi:hypothetical protein